MSDTTKIEDVTIENFDELFGIPGAESVMTSEKEDTILSPVKDDTLDLMLDETEEDLLKDIILPLGEENEEGNPKPDGKEKRVKPENAILKKFVEKGYIMPFDDDSKTLDEYTEKDWDELFQANMEDKTKELKEQTEKEFFEALPDELKYAATYVANGGNDIKGLLRALSETQEMKSLDINNPSHQEHIVRNYLYAKNFGEGNRELIEEQIEEWTEAGTLTKKASQFKPILDQMQEEIVQSKIKQQENFKKEQLARKEAYLDNVKNTLSVGELNGIKIDKKRQNMLWDEMTTVKYQSITGKPTNLLGKLLEDYQFGEKPRYDLIAEAMWLLADPDDYKAKIKQQTENKVIEETARKLKTEESRKGSGSDIADDTSTGKRQIKRRNIFER
ncbi:MAG: hypothetical protein EOL95_10435 [Bacteroidia bacterium]|nr:hypothetical protein [Bacteroidia bacterium]